jgi:hypothetical protein
MWMLHLPEQEHQELWRKWPEQSFYASQVINGHVKGGMRVPRERE